MMRAVEYLVMFFVLSSGNVAVKENVVGSGRQPSGASSGSIGIGGTGGVVNFGNEIPIEKGRSGGGGASSTSAGAAEHQSPSSQSVPGGAAAAALPARNESFANFLNDARYGRFGVGSGTSSTTGWNFSPYTSRSRIVETKYGKVQGLSITLFPNIHYSGKNNPLKNKIVEVFFGLPYASPPVKSYRFAPTQTPAPWNDVRPAIHPPPACPQILPDIRNESAALKEMPKGYLEYLRRVEPYLRNQSEDCLYLNVWSVAGSDVRLKPVLVYIHGGRFAWGSSTLYDGTVMSSQADVILVTLNYRLGILGFLNLNESPTSRPRVANYGLMDQIAALHWIKENIRNFGGDPDNITLMGYEAGAACINFLMSSPAVAPGLFHRSVLISGSAHAPWALVSDAYSAGMSVAQALNCSFGGSSSMNEFPHGAGSGTTSTTTQASRESHHGMGASGLSSSSSSSSPDLQMFDCLKSKHFSEFSKFKPPKFTIDFGPSIDGIVIKSNFRSAKEYQMGKREVSRKYDLLFGISSFERLTEFSEIDLEFGFESLRRDAVLRTLVRNSYRFHRNEILATITNEYIDWERSPHPISTRDSTLNAVTDCLSLAPVVQAASDGHIKRSFFYVFDHSTRDGLYNYQRAGAGGGEELNYMFGYPLVDQAIGSVLPFIPSPLPSNYTKGEISLSELMITYISNFCHAGDPNGPIKTDAVTTWPISKERNRYRNTIWEPYDRLHQKFLEIGLNKIRVKTHYRAHQMAIWLRLVKELERSGSQIPSTFHNRLRGGNDPALFVGSLKHFPEDDEEEPPEMTGLGGSSLQLLELPLGYGYYSFGYNGYYGSAQNSDDASLSNSEDGGGLMRGRNNNNENGVVGGAGPPMTYTTCYSPVSSSIQESSSVGAGGARNGNSTEDSASSLSAFYLSPYSTVLAITIAIGCSLLLLNILIFVLLYFRKDRGRPKTIKSSTQSLQQDNNGRNGGAGGNNKYGEPPELLKSNTTTASSFLHSASQSQSQTQLQMELEALELTVKHHQQELLAERAPLETDLQLHHHHPPSLNNPQQQQHHRQQHSTHSLSRLSLSKSSQNLKDYHHHQHLQQESQQQHFQQQQQSHPQCHQQPDLSSRGILLSPPSSSQSSSINVSSSNTEVMIPPQTLAVATLPRCNGSIGGGGGGGSYVGIKPMPPPRTAGNNFATLPHNMPLNIPPNHQQGQFQLSVDVVTSDEELRV